MKICKSVYNLNDFIKIILDTNKVRANNYKTLVYRGVSNENYKLIPFISQKTNASDEYEPAEEGDIINRERDIRGRLNVRLPKFHDLHNFDDFYRQWRELFYAQHYGIPTRLMDFSRNPLVALFFSVKNYNQKNDGAVYAVKLRTAEFYPDIINKKFFNGYDMVSYDRLALSKISPYKLTRSLFVVPPAIDQRIIAQESVFCCCSYKKAEEGETTFSMPEEDGTDYYPCIALDEQEPYKSESSICKIEIAKCSKSNILEELNRIGINFQTIYPDMEGLKNHIIWKDMR